jgi:hypothetical protein
MKRIIRQITFFAVLLSVISGCEEAFVKVIDVEQSDFPPKLSVTATLDTDSGRFTLLMKEAHSIKYYETFRSDMIVIVRDGTVRLFENDVEIHLITGPFDLSVYDYYNQNGYYVSVKGVSAVAGRTYRLEIDIDGYEKATATAIMPDEPIISDLTIDVEHPVEKKNVKTIRSLSNLGYSTYLETACTPFSLKIADNTPHPDFYSLQLEHTDAYITEIIDVSTSNLVLIQDNPDVESQDILMDGDNVDLYSFDLMMLTDATFANSNVLLDLYAPYNYEFEPYDEPSQPKPSVNTINKYTLLVRHHTQEAFRQYRSMAFQLAGLSFFTEPVFITSNMQNAYGGFSVQNTKRFVLF